MCAFSIIPKKDTAVTGYERQKLHDLYYSDFYLESFLKHAFINEPDIFYKYMLSLPIYIYIK